MADRNDILLYTHALLDAARFSDYCPNGLQVEGRTQIVRLATGVSASLSVIEAAIAWGADLLLVHHGYFWKGEAPVVTGIKRQRLQRLLANELNLVVYHLPLDAHPQLGNNAQLAAELGLIIEGRFGGTPPIACYGRLARPLSAEVFGQQLAAQLGRVPLHIGEPQAIIRRVGWCTGAAQDYLEEAAELGLDAFVTGEVSERTVHLARETGVQFYAAGHHATERYGVRALGEHLAERFTLQHRFIEIDNPV